jgi:hypothetical protein
MNLVDSSGWIEYFADEENADFFAKPIEQVSGLIVPYPRPPTANPRPALKNGGPRSAVGGR